MRGVPLLFGATPKTPLRALCVVALDALQTMRRSEPLPRERRRELALFLDFQACTNAIWDRKPVSDREYRALRQQLIQAGLDDRLREFLGSLHAIESRRPPIAGGEQEFAAVRAYREAVAQLSLAAPAALALGLTSLGEAVAAIRTDADLNILFRLAMQCQVTDDLIDYGPDLKRGLPSFLTSTASLPLALRLTADASRTYARDTGPTSERPAAPFRVAAWMLSAIARIGLYVAYLRCPVALRPTERKPLDPSFPIVRVVPDRSRR